MDTKPSPDGYLKRLSEEDRRRDTSEAERREIVEKLRNLSSEQVKELLHSSKDTFVILEAESVLMDRGEKEYDRVQHHWKQIRSLSTEELQRLREQTEDPAMREAIDDEFYLRQLGIK